MSLSDQELIAQVLSGNTEAYDVLVKRYEKQIYRYICKMGCNHEDAKGVTQGVFLKAFHALPAFKNEAKFSTWLYTIATNRCKNWLRKANKPVVNPGFASLDEKYVTPEELYLQKENNALVRGALEKIPEKYSAVLRLYYLENMTYAEISDKLSLPQRTVETRLYRGRQILKDYFIATNDDNT